MKTLTQYLFLLIIVFFAACGNTYSPKPHGYFRIELPEKQYVKFSNNNVPYSFEIPKYSFMLADSSDNAEQWWYNLSFPEMKGTIHLTYKKVNNNISEYVEDTRELVNKHTIKAEAIDPQIIEYKEKNVIAVLFEIKGDAATPYQFFATDSTTHFLRGSLYFNVYPNKDSLAPVVAFIKKDILRLIETLEWNDSK